MPTFSVLSWNAFGANLTDLANVVQNLAIDFVVIQEANNNILDTFYDPIRVLPMYTLVGALPENAPRYTTGGRIYPDVNVVRSYAYLARNTVNVTGFGLVDYTNDAAFTVPTSAFQAGQDGYGNRPPLRITLTHNGTAVILYTWHAPVGHSNARALYLFDTCARLDTDVDSGDIVVIAGDLNRRNIAAYFDNFDGWSIGLDHIIAYRAVALTGVRNTRLDPTTPALMATAIHDLDYGDHAAVAVLIDY